jgi:two-component system, LytTR family, sensor kinase
MSHSLSDLISVFALGAFFSGIIVTGSYLILATRAFLRASATRWHLLVGFSSLLWSVGALCCELGILVGHYTHDDPVLPAVALKVAATGLWITSGLAIWKTYLDSKAHTLLTLILQIGALVTGFILAVSALLAAYAPGFEGLVVFTVKGQKWFILIYSIALALYGLRLLRSTLGFPRPLWFSTALMSLGFVELAIASVARSAFSEHDGVRQVAHAMLKQSPLIIILGSLFLFARFRHADGFIRHSMRVVLGTLLACITIVTLVFTLSVGSENGIGPLQIFGSAMVVAFALAVFSSLERRIGEFIDTWVFRGPDLQQAITQLDQKLNALTVEEELVAATRSSLQKMLECEEVEIVPASTLSDCADHSLLAQGEVVDYLPKERSGCGCRMGQVRWVAPVHTQGELTHGIVLTPDHDRRVFVSQEIAYARSAGLSLGRRLCSLRREREQAERRSREARLLQQVAESELRALRAQVNPHFLFNTLNTIADLIITDPSRAETMTLRLAQVFRHVLTHSSRSLTSLEEEIGFVQKYLYIEEARFGDRLRVEITVAPGIQKHRVPSLILQPLVENALKHGLGPKPGVGHLWIRATQENDQMCLTVEDDGVGMPVGGLSGASASTPITNSRIRGAGVGLRNVTERLQALYDVRARFVLEARSAGGSRVKLLLPLEAPLAA